VLPQSSDTLTASCFLPFSSSFPWITAFYKEAKSAYGNQEQPNSTAAFKLASSDTTWYKEEYADFMFCPAKSLLLLFFSAALLTAEPEVSTRVLGMKSDYRTRATEKKVCFVLTLKCTPTGGLTLCDCPGLEQSLRLSDADGRALDCVATEFQSGQKTDEAVVRFFFYPHPRGEWMELSGELLFRLAARPVELPRVSLNLKEPFRFSLGDTKFIASPASANTEKNNLERGTMKKAVVDLRYPASTTILRLARVWKSEEETREQEGYCQELDFATQDDEDGMRTTRFSLWDAHPQETLIITTCESVRLVRVPVHFRLRLGEAEELAPLPPRQQP